VSAGPPPWETLRPHGPHVWRTLGYRLVDAGGESAIVEWDAGEEYTFPDSGDTVIVHGGLVTTLLDTAMGWACAMSLADGEGFLTANLHVEFFRPARPGTLRAEARVVERTRRVAFCAADLTDAGGQLLASARCTQVIRAD
jgi:uncharacterized protein (TIGR00369 family)